MEIRNHKREIIKEHMSAGNWSKFVVSFLVCKHAQYLAYEERNITGIQLYVSGMSLPPTWDHADNMSKRQDSSSTPHL